MMLQPTPKYKLNSSGVISDYTYKQIKTQIDKLGKSKGFSTHVHDIINITSYDKSLGSTIQLGVSKSSKIKGGYTIEVYFFKALGNMGNNHYTSNVYGESDLPSKYKLLSEIAIQAHKDTFG